MFFTPEMILMITTFMFGVISPGPDYVMIVRNSAGSTRSRGLFTALGLGAGILIHNTYSILGFGLFLNQYPIILKIVKYVGASYLTYIAIQCLRTRKAKNTENSKEKAHSMTNLQAFRIGFITEITNPNAAFFIIALFSGIANIPIADLLICNILLVSLTVAWYGFVALALTHPPLQKIFQAYKHWINWSAGGFLIFFALRLVLG